MGRCQCCTGLTINNLIDLVPIELAGHDFPQKDFYQHHDSIEDLENSANEGCDFCGFILECLKGFRDTDRWIADEWEGAGLQVEDSLYTAAKKLPFSHIKFCITSAELKIDSTLADVRAYDRLLVQVGPIKDYGNDYDLEVDDQPEFPLIWLRLSIPRDRPLFSGHLRIGRYQLDEQLESDSNMTIATTWLHECEIMHSGCLSGTLPELPTRVIDVGIDDLEILRIVQPNKLRAKYVALSHCWGGCITPVLSSKMMETFQETLPFSDLPRNFRDAVTIVRRLGIQYLWIDCLCIVQDSKKDWEQESKKMGSIYRDSTVTISALTSKGSTHGILTRESPTQAPSPRPVRIKMSIDNAQETVQVEREGFDDENLHSLDAFSILSSRGWCLQESILPPRQLYYGKRQIYWRCPAGYRSADGATSGMQVPENRFEHLSSVIFHDISSPTAKTSYPDLRCLLEDYYGLVEQYSHRQLSFGSDKFPAFSGIVQRLHGVLGGKYLAGIWSSDLALGLLWRSEMSTCEHVQPYRAPSWSWAVTDERVQFDNKDGLKDTSATIELIDDKIVLGDESNPYGQVTSASITVRGFTMSLKRSRQYVDKRLSSYYSGYGYWDEASSVDEDLYPETRGQTLTSLLLASDQDNVYILSITVRGWGEDVDADLEIDFTAIQETCLALLVHVDEKNDGQGRTSSPLQGLILKPVIEDSTDMVATFERMGMFYFDPMQLSRLEAWERKTVRLV
ncbi:HET-domain-containing protein [Dothidotthia symphoricarpi CBS 119687]|uniref:HET-domain-containing protein n=1 Tax=Dothidotthia symphoricarpi CBS 119687 TaxID=1392245 RepID=A0A6A6A1G7_9PLEO|nr:HET-domain-containing protein [Dothidotthia symphoricarpi CBS 119687]KAF2125004.1 HET-domain-containing protein [Dothidotthia symphoricarpi CBS 119687]